MLTSIFGALGRWFQRRSTPVGPQSSPVPLEALRGLREPSATELLSELRNTAWACAALNAAVCASHPPRLFVQTAPGQSPPACATRAISRMAMPGRQGVHVEEVTAHPLLDLLAQVNAFHSGHDLWELTTLYQETVGSAYWLLDIDPVLGVPCAIWPLPAQAVRPLRSARSASWVDFYEVRQNGSVQRFAAERIIAFRYPDPREPYLSGLSPLKACWEAIHLQGRFLAYKRSIWENAALPGVILSPEEAIAPEERERLETAWNTKFRRGGNGRVLVAETGLNVQVVQTSLADVAALAEIGATQADIANAFGVPLAFLTTETNLANLQAAEEQHARLTIRPRLVRRDETLNERLVPLFDPSGRLFFASDDPTPSTRERQRQQEEQDLRLGVRTVNEVRAERGLPGVLWGDEPLRYRVRPSEEE